MDWRLFLVYSVGKVGFCVLITEERKNESEKFQQTTGFETGQYP